eukprot:scaffold32426_cov14-Tisochrysis_lutea.AAC.2
MVLEVEESSANSSLQSHIPPPTLYSPMSKLASAKAAPCRRKPANCMQTLVYVVNEIMQGQKHAGRVNTPYINSGKGGTVGQRAASIPHQKSPFLFSSPSTYRKDA